MKRASTATRRCRDTISGLISASVIVLAVPHQQPAFAADFEQHVHDRLARSRLPARARRRVPRRPSARPASLPRRARVIGQMRNATSASTSTKMPPRPTMTSGPKCGSRNAADDDFLPGRRHFLDQIASMRARAIAGSAAISRIAARLHAHSPSRFVTPPASLLCRMSGRHDLHCHGGVEVRPLPRRRHPAGRTSTDFAAQ